MSYDCARELGYGIACDRSGQEQHHVGVILGAYTGSHFWPLHIACRAGEASYGWIVSNSHFFITTSANSLLVSHVFSSYLPGFHRPGIDSRVPARIVGSAPSDRFAIRPDVEKGSQLRTDRSSPETRNQQSRKICKAEYAPC